MRSARMLVCNSLRCSAFMRPRSSGILHLSYVIIGCHAVPVKYKVVSGGVVSGERSGFQIVWIHGARNDESNRVLIYRFALGEHKRLLHSLLTTRTHHAPLMPFVRQCYTVSSRHARNIRAYGGPGLAHPGGRFGDAICRGRPGTV